jgi:hypothetical protein
VGWRVEAIEHRFTADEQGELAFAAGAFVLITETAWQMAVALGPLRLGIAAVLAVATMVAWLVIDHEM